AIEPMLPEGAQIFEARAGSTMFVPRAWWHEVESLAPCFGVNFIIKNSTYGYAITDALCDLLHGDEDARDFCFGTLAGHDGMRARAEQRFEEVRARAIRILQELTPEEVYMGGRNARFVWTVPAERRSVVQTPDGWALAVPDVFEEPMPLDDALV